MKSLPGHHFLGNQMKGQHGRQTEKTEKPRLFWHQQWTDVTCSRCGKTCLSRIGFISHQRAPYEDFLLLKFSSAKQSHNDVDGTRWVEPCYHWQKNICRRILCRPKVAQSKKLLNKTYPRVMPHSQWNDRLAGCWWQSRTFVTTKTLANHMLSSSTQKLEVMTMWRLSFTRRFKVHHCLWRVIVHTVMS